MSVLVKICGITNIEDALLAAEYGADILGFVFADSPRRVSAETALAICDMLPEHVLKAGVFVNEDPVVVESITTVCGLDLLQFHGDETPEYCARFGEMAVKALRVKDEESMADLSAYGVKTFLLDAYVPGRRGGTGRKFDWSLAAEAARNESIILSGGLTPDNVAEAIEQVRPYAVDVSSGVESSPGKKNAEKIMAFIGGAKREMS